MRRWSAGTLGLVVALTPILLASDVFGREPLGEAAEGLLIHTMLAVPLLVALATGWFRPRLGALIYVVLGVLYAVALLRGTGTVGTIVFSIPLFVIAGLFWRDVSVPSES